MGSVFEVCGLVFSMYGVDSIDEKRDERLPSIRIKKDEDILIR